MSGQAVRFPLVIQVKHDPELQTAAIGDENFLAAAKEWDNSPERKAAERSAAFIADLDET